MKNIKKGDKLQIQCYKHDGNIHRSWDEAVVLDVKSDYNCSVAPRTADLV